MKILAIFLILFSTISTATVDKPAGDAIDNVALSILDELGQELFLDQATGVLKPIQLYIDELEERAPLTLIRCLKKTIFTQAIIAYRGTPNTEILMTEIKKSKSIPRPTKVDLRRIVNDVNRQDILSNFDFNNNQSKRIYIKRELKHCIAYRY